MADIIILGIIVITITVAIAYIIKEKRNGRKCIGCPYSDSCASKNRGCKKQ